MSFPNPFTWIASRIRSAVHQGFVDGLADIGALDDPPPAESPLALLRAKLAALPAAPENEEEAPKKARGK